MQKRLTLVLAVIAFAVAMSTPAVAFDPPVAVDINPDPDIVEVNLAAAETTWQFIEGIDTTVYAYNGTIPGPTIEAKVGDTVVVHFTNNLPEETTVHWHGVDTPATMDGSHISQALIQPGESFTYEFPVLHARMMWYHPHVRVFDQVEKGLYGGLLVRDPAHDAALGWDDLEEHIVFFDDILLDSGFEIVPAFSFTDPLQNAIYHLNGREGNFLLINGREASDFTAQVENGKPQRWRFINAANTTFARLGTGALCQPSLPETCKLWEVGSDGGLLEQRRQRLKIVPFSCGLCGPEGDDEFPEPLHPTVQLLSKTREGIFLMPGERMEIIFTPIGDDGQSWQIWQHDWLRGRHIAQFDPEGNILLFDDPLDGIYPEQEYMRLQVNGPNPGTGEFEPSEDLLTDIVVPGGTKGVLPVTFGHAPPDPQGNVVLFAQADFSSGTMVPLPAPLIDSFNAHDVEVGDVWTWQVTNLTHGDHPFHTHGFTFIPTEVEFKDLDNPSEDIVFKYPFKHVKDTIRVPARGGTIPGRSMAILRGVVEFDDTGREGQVAAQGQLPTFDPQGAWTSGGWLFHCHVLEHSAKGMLSFYEVHDPNDPFTLLGKHLAGTNGLPSLTAEGDLSPGSTVTFNLVNAAPNAEARLVAGLEAKRAEVAGGELVPNMAKVWTTTTDGDGNATWNITEWNNAASGKDIYWQVGIKDSGAVKGWAMSNAMVFTKP